VQNSSILLKLHLNRGINKTDAKLLGILSRLQHEVTIHKENCLQKNARKS
jgi:hypothetical protein